MRIRRARALAGVAVVGAMVAVASGHGWAASEPADPGATPRLNQVVTIAGTGGSGFSGDGGPAVDAQLSERPSISVADDGSVYIVDDDRQVVRRVGADGMIDTVPGLAAQDDGQPEPEPGPATLGRSNKPWATATGPDGSLYVTSDLGIARVDPEGEVAVVAGAGEDTEGVDGAQAVDVRVVRSADIDVDAAGNVYVIDAINAKVRRVDADGILSTVAGGGELSLRDGEGQPATEVNLVHDFGGPSSVEVDSRGNVYVQVESSGAVFKVDPDGIFTMVTGTVAGFGGDGGPAIDAALGGGARSIAVDGEDNVFIADGNDRIRMVDPGGTISTVGPRLEGARQIVAGPDGNLYLAGHARVRMLVLNAGPVDDDAAAVPEPADSPWADEEPGTVVTIAGTEQAPDETTEASSETTDDADPVAEQPALDVRLGHGVDIAVDSQNRLFVADVENERVGVVVDGVFSPLDRADRSLAGATMIAASVADDVYAVTGDDVVRVDPDGAVVTIAGGGPEDGEVVDGQNALTASFDATGIAVGPDGTVYVGDDRLDRLYAVGADGTISVLADLAEHGVTTSGGIAADAGGTVYVADPDGNRVLAVGTSGAVTTVAGNGEERYVDEDPGGGGRATEVPVDHPTAVVVDADGTLYANAVDGIRRIDTDGTITTVLASPTDGEGASVTQFYQASSLALGPHGDLYFLDGSTNQVRVLVRPGEMAGPFPWLPVGLGAGAILLVAAAVVTVLLRRRRAAGPADSSAMVAAAPMNTP